MNKETEYQINMLVGFVGGKITQIVHDDECVGFTVKKGKTETNLWIQRDPEGNGPGWVSPESA